MVPPLIYIYLCPGAVGNLSTKAFSEGPWLEQAGEAGITDTSATKRQKKPKVYKHKQSLLRFSRDPHPNLHLSSFFCQSANVLNIIQAPVAPLRKSTWCAASARADENLQV